MKHTFPELNLANPPEWFKKQAREMTNEEVFERLVDINRIKNEAKEVLAEIPKVIKFLELIYPGHPSMLIRFKEWIKRIEEDAK